VRTRTAVLVLLAVLGVAVAGMAALLAVRAGEALPGTTVSGVDVGGLGRTDVRARLAAVVDEQTTGTLELVHEELRFPVQREDLGLDVDLDATVHRALAAGRTDGLDRVLGPVLGRGTPVDLTVHVAGGGLAPFVASVGDAVDRAPFPGGIAVEGTTVTAQPPLAGRELDRDQARTDLEVALATGRTDPLPLPVAQEPAGTTADDVEHVAAQAREALSAPLRLSAPQAVLEVAPAELGPLLRAQPDGPGLRLGLDREALTAFVEAEAQRIDRTPVQATFVTPPAPTVDTQGDLTWTPQPATVTVQPGRPGYAVKVDEAVEAVAGLVGSPAREAPLPLEPRPPAFSAADAGAAGLTSLLGTFTTYFAPGQPRVTNIRRIASVVDGTYVPPGERLSLNEVAGRRTTAKGYVADSAIIDGELQDQVGGGVSQFATTLFNAAFFAGLPIEAHKPHSFYISRYPAGRESTVSYGSIEVVVRNDTASGMVVRTASTPRSVTVAIYGDNGGRTVTSTSGPRRPRAGGGFTIEVTRSISGGDGRGERRVFRTTYNPPPEGH
jgi:vancomycin resistance protein YoaR